MRSAPSVQLNSIEQFCKAAELGSFSAAAESLGLTPASVSRAIRRLEERLGVRLFSRTTRRVRLTREGELYHEECQRALEQIAEAERAITGHQRIPSGVLRISVGILYGNFRLLPRLPLFSAAYPQIEVEVSLSDRIVDFVEEGYDLAIRLGTLPDSGLIAHPLEEASVGVFATPTYLARKRIPQTLEDLANHDCIQFILPTSGRPMPWIFRDQTGQDVELVLPSHQRVHDDALGCVSWGRAGGGLFQSYHFITQAALERGELIEVLQAYGGRHRPFTVLYPRNRHLSARVRAFIDFMSEALRATAIPEHRDARPGNGK